MINISLGQSAAYRSIEQWLKTKDRPFFYLAGYAGTGKTSIAQKLVEGRKAVFAAYTGKAAEMMARRGCQGATTIHRLIYRPAGFGSDPAVASLRLEIEELSRIVPAPRREMDAALGRLRSMQASAGGIGFELNRDDPEIALCDVIVLDECFAKGSMITTIMGPRPIETILPGDTILNANGADTVVAVKRKEAESCAKINAGGKTIFCSEDHPFFTDRGLVLARDLEPRDRLVSATQAMRLLQDGFLASPGADKVLLSKLRDALEDAVSRNESPHVYAGESGESRRRQEEISAFWIAGSESADRSYKEAEPDFISGGPQEDQRQVEGSEISRAEGWKRMWAYGSPAGYAPVPWRGVGDGAYGGNGASEERHSDTLQAGRGEPGADGGHRAGRALAQHNDQESIRREAGYVSSWPRVARVSILQSGHPELESRRDADGKFYLYDLQAERHHSFEVEGVLVHNCSMVPNHMMDDLISFGKPILVLGDPGQLPPVKGEGFFTKRKPDAMLTEIHRQAADSGILQIATMVREGKRPAPGEYGIERSFVLPTEELRRGGDMGMATLRHADQVICGYNRTKTSLNAFLRGFSAPVLPVKGDKLVCLRNNHDRGFYNGSTMVAVEDAWEHGRTAYVDVERDGVVENVEIDRAAIAGAGPGNDYDLIALDYAWAMTCHKAQGSQWGKVLVLDESDVARDYAKEWLYTATSRASEKLVLAIS